MEQFKFSLSDANDALTASGKDFATVFTNGTMRGLIYKPNHIDSQTPHEQDEVYVVISGSGQFLRGEETVAFEPGDFIFVPAHMTHKFLNFTDDFKVWVVFYGKDGDENS